ncbi:MAG: hypothetical protein ACI4R9_04325 [Kiritimatiellia bacterium]
MAAIRRIVRISTKAVRIDFDALRRCPSATRAFAARRTKAWLPESWNGDELRLVGYAIDPTTANCLKAAIDINDPANPGVEFVPLTPAISADPDGSSGDSQ